VREREGKDKEKGEYRVLFFTLDDDVPLFPTSSKMKKKLLLTMNSTSSPLLLSFSRNGELSTALRDSPVM
jgi:hypothetical protein